METYRGHTFVIEHTPDHQADDFDYPNSYGNGKWREGPDAEAGKKEIVSDWTSLWLRDYDLEAGFDSPEEFKDYFGEEKFRLFAVRAYIHGNIALSLNSNYPFNDQWDSGYAGLIAIRLDKSLSADEQPTKAYEGAEQTIAKMNAIFAGEWYGYEIEGPCSEDSCWGYLITGREDHQELEEEIKVTIDVSIQRAIKDAKITAAEYASQQTKAMIKKRIPLLYRQPNPGIAELKQLYKL